MNNQFHKLCLILTMAGASIAQENFSNEQNFYPTPSVQNVYQSSYVNKLFDHIASKRNTGISQAEINILMENKTPGGVHIHFEQVINDVPVFGSKSSVTFNNSGEITTTFNNFKLNVNLSSYTAGITYIN